MLQYEKNAKISSSILYAGDGTSRHLNNEFKHAGPITLAEGQFKLGRDEGNDIRVDVPSVSGAHAKVLVGKYTP